MLHKLLAMLLLFGIAISSNAQEIYILGAKNSKNTISPQTIEAALTKAGFQLGDNRDMNGPYQKQFGKTDFSIYNLYTFHHPEMTNELLAKYPEFGIFTPMSMGIYQKKGENTIYAAVLTAKTQAKILGHKSVDPLLKKLEKAVQKAMKQGMQDAFEVSTDYRVKAPEDALITRYALEVDEDWEESKDELEMMIEDGLKPRGFVMANFTDLYSDENGYDFFESYSICKLEVIYTTSQTRPETGAFAPCSLAIFKRKGVDEIELMYQSVFNWLSSAGIESEAARKALLKAQEGMQEILLQATE